MRRRLTSTGSASTIFGFAGEVTDANNVIYLRARYLRPKVGIFFSRDPVSGNVMQPESMNGFGYVDGDPVNLTDPSGKMGEPICNNPINNPLSNYPDSSRVYAEGAAAVATGYLVLQRDFV